MSANPLPALSESEYASLRESIRANGVLEPIIVSCGPACDREVGDGHHRLKACEELGIDCPRQLRTFGTEAEFRVFQLTVNIARRQLTIVQRAELGMALEPWERQLAAERKAATQAKQGEPWIGAKDGDDQMVRTIGRGAVREIIGPAVGLSPMTYARVSSVLKSDEEDLKEALRDGTIRPSRAEEELRRRRNGSAPVEKPAITEADKKQLAVLDASIARLTYELAGALTMYGLITDGPLHPSITPEVAAQRATEIAKIVSSLRRLRNKLTERASQ